MDGRRVLIRLWVVGSVLWVAFVGWLVGEGSTFPDPNLLVTATLTLGPPMAVLGLGSVVLWVIQRFVRRHRTG